MRWITANQLETWARGLGSRTELSKVVSDLIRATADDITAIRFPNGDKGQVRGFDGHLDSSVTKLNVPEGYSIWEFGTSEKYKEKAKADFDSRTSQVSAVDQEQTTLVLVSPWTWDSSDPTNKIEDWIAARRKESAWKEIRFVDGAQLEHWLEQCPGVSAWHAATTLELRPLSDLRSTEEFWRDYSGQFGPQITEEVLLCEREGNAKELLDRLMQDGNIVQCVADAQDEAVAFTIAAIRKATPEIRLFLEARTLVVDSTSAGRQLLGHKHLVLLLRNDATRSPGQFSPAGSTLVPLGRQQRNGLALTLSRPSGQAMGRAMVSMGLEENKALTLARGSGRSLTALARLIPGGTLQEPGWVSQGMGLLPAILAGAWDSSNVHDQSIVQQIAGGATCREVEGRVRPLLSGADPPFDLEGTVWKVRAPMDAFVRIGGLIGPDELELLRKAMIEVFGRLEPEIDPSDIVAVPRTSALGHSEWLRQGLATTLLLLAVWSDSAGVKLGHQTGQAFADQVVTELPGLTGDSRLLTSLRVELPLLAEAAPLPLLSALEQLLEGDLMRPLFNETEGLVFPTSKHTGVLWALETLAWDPEYFHRAVMVLARLASIDPGGSLNNRPIRSLSEIFLPWHPQTNAASQQRLATLDQLIQLIPDIGWQLIVSLLPTMSGSSFPTAKPRLREGGAATRSPVTYGELAQMHAAAVQSALKLAGLNVNRWDIIIRGWSLFPATERGEALLLLDAALSQLESGRRKQLWGFIRAEVRRHKRFKSAKWAMSEEDLGPLEELLKQYAPPDTLEPIIWLFNDWSLDETADATAAADRRTDALKQLCASGDVDSIFRLGVEAKMPHLVVDSIAGAALPAQTLNELLERSAASAVDAPFTLGLMALYRQSAGAEIALQWISDAFTAGTLSEASVARLLLAWPDDVDTWRDVRRFGKQVELFYWRLRPPRFVAGAKRSLLRALLMLLSVDRAIVSIESCSNRLAEVPTRLVLRMLDTLVQELNNKNVAPDNMVTYLVGKTFDALDGRSDVTTVDVARREYALLPLLEFGERKLKIHSLMASDPAFFHEILRAVYFGKNEPKPDVIDPVARGRARISYSLLSHFHKLPGFTGSGIDGLRLSSWIDELRRLGAETDRDEITDHYVGKVLAHAPADDDGGWPHRVVRDEIERLASDEIERAIGMERYNMRGVTSRAMYEGGGQERGIARHYYDSAQAANSWPRTFALLTAMARSWEDDGAREDVQAAQRKLQS